MSHISSKTLNLKAPFAGMVLIGFCVDVSSFLGEFRAERDDRLHTAKEILDWALLGAEVLELCISAEGCITQEL